MKKLSRVRDGENTIIFQVAGFDPLSCDFSTLSPEIQHKLLILGGGSKIGDSAAGIDGLEAYEAICSTWKTLKSGEWKERVVRGKSNNVPVADIKAVMATLSEEERAAAIAIFKKLGKDLA